MLTLILFIPPDISCRRVVTHATFFFFVPCETLLFCDASNLHPTKCLAITFWLIWKTLCISDPMVYLRPSCYFRKMQVMFLYLELYVLFVFSTLFFANSLFFVHHTWILSLTSYSTSHAGVIPCCRHDSFVVPLLYCSWISRRRLRLGIRFGAMPTEKSANVNLQKEGMLKVKCVGVFCCDITMSYFCHHSHQSACSEKAEWRLRPSPTWFWVWKFKKKQNKSKSNDRSASFTFLVSMRSGENLDFIFPILWINAELQKKKKKKNFLCRNGSSSISHLVLIWDILHTFVTLCGAVVPR